MLLDEGGLAVGIDEDDGGFRARTVSEDGGLTLGERGVASEGSTARQGIRGKKSSS